MSKLIDQPIHDILNRLGRLTTLDFLWLAEECKHRLNDGYLPKLHGIKGGHSEYIILYGHPDIEAIADGLSVLQLADLRTIEIVSRQLHDLMSPKIEQSRGNVQLKTIVKQHPVIDWPATAKNHGIEVYVTDADGQTVMENFPYTYAYVRIYASKGGKNRNKKKLLSKYADRGMGKGGIGGIVAAAYQDKLVTEDEILDAWHEGKQNYLKFIEDCAEKLGLGGQGELGLEAADEE